MIPSDCLPQSADERVAEILEGPDREGKLLFFLYWIGQGYFQGPRGQVFRAKLEDHQHDRVVDRR